MLTARRRDFFVRHVVELMVEKYELPEMEAIRRFVSSLTYELLNDKTLALDTFSPHVIFDLWENEQITGNPMTSGYMREG